MNLLSLLFLCSSLSVQDATPSLAETLQWLKEALPVKAVSTGKVGKADFSERVSGVEFNKCALVLTLDSTVNGLESPQSVNRAKREFDFSLEQMDFEQVYIIGQTHLSLMLKTKGDQSLIKLNSDLDSSVRGIRHTGTYTKKVSLPMPNKETAERFQQAFTQAIKLCQVPR